MIEISDEHVEKIREAFVYLIAIVAQVNVVKAPQTLMAILTLLVNGKFFTESNSAWVIAKQKLLEIINRIVYAIKLYQKFFNQHSLTKALIVFLTEQSVKFSQIVFAIPKMSAILGEDLYNALKNEFERSLNNNETLENTVLSFIR